MPGALGPGGPLILLGTTDDPTVVPLGPGMLPGTPMPAAPGVPAAVPDAPIDPPDAPVAPPAEPPADPPAP